VSAAEALRIAHAAGVTVIVDGEDLVLEANTEPPRAVLDALSRNKLSITAEQGIARVPLITTGR
jgi:hypothetical protein